MKEKDILKVIKTTITDNTPNIIDRIDLDSIEIAEVEKVEKRRAFSFFKAWPVMAFAMGVLVLALIVVGISTRTPNGGGGGFPSLTKVTVTPKDKVVAGYAITGVNLFGGSSGQAYTLSYNKNTNQTPITSSVSNPVIDDFHDYFYLVEDYLKLSEVNIEIYVNEDEGYNYKYKMIVKTENLFGNVTEYILYYDEERDIDDDEEEKEMTGILIYQNVTYQFKSEEEIEADESEIKVTIYANDYNDRLEIEKEFEDGEYQYTYKLYRNDDEYLSVELEVEESEKELIIKKKNEDDHEFLIVSQPNNTFNITYDEEFIFTLVIDIENKKYIYSFDETIITK